MKKSQIEKQLKSQLRESAPSDFSSVWSRCEGQKIKQEEKMFALGGTNETVSTSCSKFKPFALMLATILAFAFMLFPFIGGGGTFPMKKFSKGYFLFDVNPSVEVHYDEKGIVTKTEGLNEDGKALLIGLRLEDVSYEEAAKKLMKRCVELGYFSAERTDNALLTTAIKENGTKDEQMTSALKQTMTGHFASSKLRGVVITGVSTPALVEEGQKYGIDGQKYGLIQTYLTLGGTLTEAEYSTLSIRDLYLKISEKQLELKEQSRTIYKQIFEGLELKLHETLTAQIEMLLTVLNGVLTIEIRTTNKFTKIEEYVQTLQYVSTQEERKILIEKVLLELDAIKAEETDFLHIIAIDNAKSAIIVTYDILEEAFKRLEKVSATPERISFEREKKFESFSTAISKNYDAKAWQAEMEQEFSYHWYDLKSAWEESREKDI